MFSEWQGGTVREVRLEVGSLAYRLLRESSLCASEGLAGAMVGVGP